MSVLLGFVQTWCPGSALGHGHQCECSILVVPVQKLEHGTRVRALSPKVVFRHRTRARALVCTIFYQCHVFYPCFPTIWSCGGDKMAGAKWTIDETISLIDAYSVEMAQETMEGIASNKELHEQLQQIMKEQSNVNRTPQQIETKLRAPRCSNSIPFSARAQCSGMGTKSGRGLSLLKRSKCTLQAGEPQLKFASFLTYITMCVVEL